MDIWNHWNIQACGTGVFGPEKWKQELWWATEVAVLEKAGDHPSPLSAHAASYTAVRAAPSQPLNPPVFRVYLKAHSSDARL